jgi:hypothetical protein
LFFHFQTTFSHSRPVIYQTQINQIVFRISQEHFRFILNEIHLKKKETPLRRLCKPVTQNAGQALKGDPMP